MEKKIVGIFVCMLMCATALSVAGTANVEEMTTDANPTPNLNSNAGTSRQPGTILWWYDVETPTGDYQCLGVEYDGTYFWVTGGYNGSDPNKLYQFTDTGGLFNTYDQPPHTAGWGWRDLAFDGTYLYAGSDNGMIDQISPSTGTWTGTSIPGPFGINRAIAYDPANDYFYVANWASNIEVIDSSGTSIDSLPNSLSLYGLAWDDICPGGPWLWGYSQDGTGPYVQISQIDPATGAETGTYYTGLYNDPGDMAGGCCFIDKDGFGQFVGLTQDTPDLIFGMEICSSTPNQPPYVPSNPVPANGTICVDIHTCLSWTGGDPDSGDTVTYDVYLDTTTPPTTMVASGISATTYCPPAPLLCSTTYYWQIVATDSHGASTPGPIWDFTTGDCNLQIDPTSIKGGILRNPPGIGSKIQFDITNTGCMPCTNVVVTITAAPGVLFMAPIPPIASIGPVTTVTVTSPNMFGFGLPATLHINAQSPDCGSTDTQTASAWLFVLLWWC